MGRFRLEALVSSARGGQVFRARDDAAGRSVLVRIAEGESGRSLLEDSRRLAAVSHPGLVVVLEASGSDMGAYVAVSDPGAVPVSDGVSLSPEQAARMAIDIAGAIEALAAAGLRAAINASTVLVAETDAGVRGLLDPFRLVELDTPRLLDADPVTSTAELATVTEFTVPAPSAGLRTAIDRVRSGVASGPAEFAQALAPLAIPRTSLAQPRRRNPAAYIVGACLAAAGAALVVYVLARGTARPVRTAQVPVARIVARIPLGLSGGEVAGRFAILGHSAWVASSTGRMIQVDLKTREVSGTPVALGGSHPRPVMTAYRGDLYTADSAGWLMRFHPATRQVTARRRLGGSLTAIQAAGNVLWVLMDDGATGKILRVDPLSLRAIGRSIAALPSPRQMVVRGSRSWVLGGSDTGQIVRVDAVAHTRRLTSAGNQIQRVALQGDVVWFPDFANHTVSALDAESMSFHREAIVTPGHPMSVLPLGAELWVASSNALSLQGLLRLDRFDARSGRRSERGVPLGRGVVYAMAPHAGSIWVLTSTTLIKLEPHAPHRGLESPNPVDHRALRQFRTGPLAAGTWQTTLFAKPLTFSTREFAWIGNNSSADSFSIIAARATFAALDVSAPRQVYAPDGSTRNLTTPARLLTEFRRHPHLRVGVVHHVLIGGERALQFKLEATHAGRHPEVCGPVPCELIFPIQEGTNRLEAGHPVRISLVSIAGRVLVFAEDSNAYNPVALRATASLLRTFRFAA